MAYQKAYNLLIDFFVTSLGPRDLSRQLEDLVCLVGGINGPARGVSSAQQDQLHRAVPSRSQRDQLLQAVSIHNPSRPVASGGELIQCYQATKQRVAIARSERLNPVL